MMGHILNPTAADTEKILSNVGIEAEVDKINKIISELKGEGSGGVDCCMF